MVKVAGNLKELIDKGAVQYISLNKEKFRSTTPGPMGPDGPRGPQGVGVHHMKGTSTTDSEGDFGTFGELDTYTFYGDASETINLGYFIVRNGITPEMTEGLGIMKRSTYDINRNGIVDNSERLEGRVAAEFVNIEDAQDIGGIKTFTSDVVIQGNLTIHGTETVVNSETVTTKDNQIVINDGEVGAGVTAGKAGIKVDRGTEPDYEFVFVEVDGSFRIGKEGELQKVATREDTPIDTGVAVWDSTSSKFNTTRDISIESLNTTGQVNNRNMVVDGEKLDGIEEGATGDQTAEEILALLKTVDGSGSGVDADLLDGQEGAYYLNASNINTGTINDSYLPDTITSDITGNAGTATKLATARTIGGVAFDGSTNINLPGVNIAGNQNTTGNSATATKLKTARTITLTGDVSGDVSFDGSINVNLATTVADNSHKHTISNVEGLQDILSDLQENIDIITEIEEW